MPASKAKKVVSKAIPKKVSAKPVAKKPAKPAPKKVAAKPVAKKPAAKPVAKKVTKPAPKKAAAKPAAKKPSAKPTAKKAVTKKAVTKKAAVKPLAKKSVKAVAKPAKGKPVAKKVTTKVPAKAAKPVKSAKAVKPVKPSKPAVKTAKELKEEAKLAKALAQFERTLISSNSNWDKAERRERLRTQSEINGLIIFSTEKGDCFHCHGNPNSAFFTDFVFHNNGLEAMPKDSGLMRITGRPEDLGLMKTPTLRNLSFTAPYMHDGRFKTLMEVIEFYNSGTKNSPTVDPMISKSFPNGGLNLTPMEKKDLLNFLLSLNDSSFVGLK